MDHSCPSVQDSCVFVEYLAKWLASPASILNYVSSIRQYMKRAGFSPSSFDSYRVQLALEAHKRTKSHVPRPAPPMNLSLIRRIMYATIVRHMGNTTRLAFLLLYYAGLRQSEVAPATPSRFDPLRHITRSDARCHGSLVLKQKWSKTMQLTNTGKSYTLHPRISFSAKSPHTFKSSKKHPHVIQNSPCWSIRTHFSSVADTGTTPYHHGA